MGLGLCSAGHAWRGRVCLCPMVCLSCSLSGACDYLPPSVSTQVAPYALTTGCDAMPSFSPYASLFCGRVRDSRRWMC